MQQREFVCAVCCYAERARLQRLAPLATAQDDMIIAFRAEKTEAIRKQGVAMWAALDVVREHVGSFAAWPEPLQRAFAEAIIDNSPLTTAEIAHGQALAKKYGWSHCG